MVGKFLKLLIEYSEITQRSLKIKWRALKTILTSFEQSKNLEEKKKKKVKKKKKKKKHIVANKLIKYKFKQVV